MCSYKEDRDFLYRLWCLCNWVKMERDIHVCDILVVSSVNDGKCNCKGFFFFSFLFFPTSPSQAYNLAIKSSFLLDPVITFNLLRAMPQPESFQTCLLMLAKTNLQILLFLSAPWKLLFNSCVSQTLKIHESCRVGCRVYNGVGLSSV